MARKIIVQLRDGSSPILTESEADDEAQLQNLIKGQPDLLPIEEFGMTGPMMVVGRETWLPSGALDLLGLTRRGEIILVEFKTGPQNSDFRHAIAQMLDYGSDLWAMDYEQFERDVAVSHFHSSHCEDDNLSGQNSLIDAALATWPDMTEDDQSAFVEGIRHRLDNGNLAYALVAQRFTDSMFKTLEYMNKITTETRFFAVEIVRFTAEGVSAFETRTVLQPARIQARRSSSASAGTIDQKQFLESIEDENYREALRSILGTCSDAGLRLRWGSIGTSFRVPVPETEITIAWLYSPGSSGWMGLTDLTLAYDRNVLERVPNASEALSSHISGIGNLDGVEHTRPDFIEGYRFSPDIVLDQVSQITKAMVSVARAIQEAY